MSSFERSDLQVEVDNIIVSPIYWVQYPNQYIALVIIWVSGNIVLITRSLSRYAALLLCPCRAVTLASRTGGLRPHGSKRAHSCHVNIVDTRRFGNIKVDLQISADASEPVLRTSFGCAQVWVDFWSLKMFKSCRTLYS